jgi:adenine C2-methylase RlmN of 23S rRNA A2503 and tRNA A37
MGKDSLAVLDVDGKTKLKYVTEILSWNGNKLYLLRTGNKGVLFATVCIPQESRNILTG